MPIHNFCKWTYMFFHPFHAAVFLRRRFYNYSMACMGRKAGFLTACTFLPMSRCIQIRLFVYNPFKTMGCAACCPTTAVMAASPGPTAVTRPFYSIWYYYTFGVIIIVHKTIFCNCSRSLFNCRITNSFPFYCIFCQI